MIISCIFCNMIRPFLACSCFWTFQLGQQSLPILSLVLKDTYQLPHNFVPVNEMLPDLKRDGQFSRLEIRMGLLFWFGFYFTKTNVCMGEI